MFNKDRLKQSEIKEYGFAVNEISQKHLHLFSEYVII